MIGLLSNMKTLNYSSKERLIGLLVIPPVAIAINFFVFGATYFDGFRHFRTAEPCYQYRRSDYIYSLQYDRHDHAEPFFSQL